MHRVTIVRGAVSLVLATIGSAWAGEGRIPIFEPVVLNGALGDISGRYVVTQNITATSPNLVIAINGTGTESIDLDLNGFTLTGSVGAPDVIRVNDVREFRIHDGTLRAQDPATNGLQVYGSTGDDRDKVSVENVRTIDGYVALWLVGIQNVEIRNNLMTGAGYGIEAGGGGDVTGVVESNILRDIGDRGMTVSGTVDMLIRNNRCENVTGAAMFFDVSQGLRIESNSVSAGGAGITVSAANGCTVVENNVIESSQSGFGFGDTSGCLIQNNVARGNLGHGMVVSGSSYANTFRGNVLSGNAAVGLFMLDNCDRGVIEGNTLVDNGDYGLVFFANADANVYRGNVARGNGGAACGTATCGAPDFCDLGAGNTSVGDNFMPGPPPC